MCGIYGFVSQSREINPEILPCMGLALKHRGPDDGDERITISDTGCVALGHKRLSIIDLSAAGRQPMANEDESVWLTLNGEIYNYQELRHELEAKGHRFRSHSDSEVVVHLYEERGAGCLAKLKGMFAFALWDSKQKSLLLARDRIGKKPLHYCLTGDGVIFASEIKAPKDTGFSARPDAPYRPTDFEIKRQGFQCSIVNDDLSIRLNIGSRFGCEIPCRSAHRRSY